mmetsp:Transcript_33479/g.58659  ORF Transcript_33479/g.58659 Transcript_33479/m.58659 type:complete len:164 (-) Transcript_33479:1585-2076(-)
MQQPKPDALTDKLSFVVVEVAFDDRRRLAKVFDERRVVDGAWLRLVIVYISSPRIPPGLRDQVNLLLRGEDVFTILRLEAADSFLLLPPFIHFLSRQVHKVEWRISRKDKRSNRKRIKTISSRSRQSCASYGLTKSWAMAPTKESTGGTTRILAAKSLGMSSK